MLWRASLRFLLHHPWQMGLSLLGIALGVAVVLSIDLANESARRSFTLFTESIAGRATHQMIGGPSGLPEEVYRALRVEAGVQVAAPVVEREVAAPEFPGRTLHLMGIDPFAEVPFRPFASATGVPSPGDLAGLLTRSSTALIARNTAQQLGLGAGDSLVIRIGTVRHRLTLVGEVAATNELSARALENLLITDIATAQEIIGARGVLSRIDLIVPGDRRGEEVLGRVRAVLPPGSEVVPAGRTATAIEQMTRAFRLNLTALSLLALVVALFLVYNAMTFSIVQRRALIGGLRVLGVTRREIFWLVLGEAGVIGGAATAVGLLLGVVLAHGLVGLVTRTINDLYVVLSVRELAIPPLALAKAACLGVGGTVLAAIAPAFEATTTAPRAALIRSTMETRARSAIPRLALAGALFALAGGGVVLVPVRSVTAGYGGLFAILLGAALATPAATVALVRVLRPAMGRLFGLPGRMAAGAIVAALSRTAVALAALMIAIATAVGVGIMIGSFRHTVVRWLEASLAADVYVSPPSLVRNRPDATLDPALIARLAAVPGIARVSTHRGVRVESTGGPVHLVALDLDARGYRSFSFRAGDPGAIQAALEAGEAVVVSEPFAYHRRLEVGARIRLTTDRGPREFPIVGVFHDYGSSVGVVMLSRRTYERFWDDRQVSSLGIHVVPGFEVDALVGALRHAAGTEQEILIRSNRALREASLEIFDRTFAVTVVLRLLATVVAFAGVLSALMALGLERVREFGVLRAQGLTPREVWGLVTAQTGLMGLIAGLLAVPVGVALALVLIFVINQRSFGWTLQLEVAPALLAHALLLTVVAALLAGLYPAWRMTRLALPAALQDE
jgi:putative ABC transport system permease protein